MACIEKNKTNESFESSVCLRDLPLLEYIFSVFKNKINLEKTLIICTQHIVATTYTMFHYLFRLGLKPQNLLVIGKCYSSFPTAYKELEKIGVRIAPSSLEFNSYKSFDYEFDRSIDLFLNDIFSKPMDTFEKIIVLDDGGHLLSKIPPYFKNYNNVVGIEQTSSGYNRLKENKLFFPIINLARSSLKLKRETPIIMNIIKKKIGNYISLSNGKNKIALIMGNGILGNTMYEILNPCFNAFLFDKLPEKYHMKNENLDDVLKKADLIIGCTGTISLSHEKHALLKKNVTLISISSSDREFDSVYLRKKYKFINNCHTDIQVNGITLTNCGFPINFDDDYEAIDPNDFQLTRALIFSSIYQAYFEKNETKWIELDKSLQNILEKYFISIYNKNYYGIK